MRSRLAPSLTSFILAAKRGHLENAIQTFHNEHIPQRYCQQIKPSSPGWANSRHDDKLDLPCIEAATLARSIMSIHSREQHINFHRFERHADFEKDKYEPFEERAVIREGLNALAQLRSEINKLAQSLHPETLMPEHIDGLNSESAT